ncbi:MAG: IgGFc-binding protein [Labilithrix sp.]|nr:IgGFc-binding protein [Labilithrix sp.]
MKHPTLDLRALSGGLFAVGAGALLLVACGSDRQGFETDTSNNGPAGAFACGSCTGQEYTACDGSGKKTQQQCAFGQVCIPNMGCGECMPGETTCVGDEVRKCDDNGKAGELVATCDAKTGHACSEGACVTGCEAAAVSQSNVGCEFWSVDLDQSDGVTNPASSKWGLVLSNASQIPSHVKVEQNDAVLGGPQQLSVVFEGTIPVNDLVQIDMPQREVDCGKQPDDKLAPGTCLSSRAFRVTSSAPIVAYQFNNMVHNYSTDASLLLPTAVFGTLYRNVGWGSGLPYPIGGPFGNYVQRAYITIVGTEPGTTVTVNPSWKIKGNAPINATPAGGTIQMTIGPFDVLNLESDDATIGECTGPSHMKPPYCTDLTGSIIQSNKPIGVFSGTESSGVGPLDAPKPPDWGENSGCCKQHLEEQLPPLEAIGKKFIVTRSPIRSIPGNYKEPDVLRFVGAAATAEVTTTLPAPLDKFTIKPGEIIDTWTDRDVTVVSTEPLIVAQFLVAQDYVNGPRKKGDPSFTIFHPIEQARNEYVFLSPPGWKENWVVIATEKGNEVKVDGSVPTDCIVSNAGTLDGKDYESRRCPLPNGVHRLSGTGGFNIMAYGYGDADCYSFAGGAFVKKIYKDPPPLVLK